MSRDGGADSGSNQRSGPTGDLCAPTLVVGKTVVVGFNDERYQELL
jgi:hypothetical protein